MCAPAPDSSSIARRASAFSSSSLAPPGNLRSAVGDRESGGRDTRPTERISDPREPFNLLEPLFLWGGCAGVDARSRLYARIDSGDPNCARVPEHPVPAPLQHEEEVPQQELEESGGGRSRAASRCLMIEREYWLRFPRASGRSCIPTGMKTDVPAPIGSNARSCSRAARAGRAHRPVVRQPPSG